MFAGLKMGRVTCTRRNVGSLKEPGSANNQQGNPDFSPITTRKCTLLATQMS